MSDRPPSLLDRTDERRVLAERLPMPPAVVAGAVVALVLGVVLGLLAGAVWGVLVGLLSGLGGGAATFVALRNQAATAGRTVLGGSPVVEATHARLVNLVEGLSITTGEEAPELRVVEDPGLNLAVAGAPGDAVMVLTTGLLDALDRVELEAVLSEGMARIRSHDAHLGEVAARTICGPLVAVGPVRGTPGTRQTAAAERRAQRLRALLGEQRDLLADLAAVDVTRYPPALGTALEKLAVGGTAVAGATWGTCHLWLADPLADAGGEVASRLNDLFRIHQPMDHRVGLMAEL